MAEAQVFSWPHSVLGQDWGPDMRSVLQISRQMRALSVQLVYTSRAWGFALMLCVAGCHPSRSSLPAPPGLYSSELLGVRSLARGKVAQRVRKARWARGPTEAGRALRTPWPVLAPVVRLPIPTFFFFFFSANGFWNESDLTEFSLCHLLAVGI